MSYSYFLAHGLALNAVWFVSARLIPAHTQSVVLFVIFLVANVVLTLATALVLFALVEKPLSLATVKPPKARAAACGQVAPATGSVGVA
jgi:peptidoglycan/LPS O-acetylase OafA/YrhL